ncbi:cysteine-rich receptor-like protein kinase 10-like protein, partial [Trifolium pratense]
MFYLWLLAIKLICFFPFAYTEPLDYRYACVDKSSVPPSSTYQTNLNNLLSVLTSDSAISNGFGNRTSGNDLNDMVYGLYFCRGDANATLCNSCIQYSSKLIKQKRVWRVFSPSCVIMYETQPFLLKGIPDDVPGSQK